MSHLVDEDAARDARGVWSARLDPPADGANVSVVPTPRVAGRPSRVPLRRIGAGRHLAVFVVLTLCWLPASVVEGALSTRSLSHPVEARPKLSIPLPLDSTLVMVPPLEAWAEASAPGSLPTRTRRRVMTESRPLRRGFLEEGDSGDGPDVLKKSTKHRSRRPVGTPRRRGVLTRPWDQRVQAPGAQTLLRLLSAGTIAARAPPVFTPLCVYFVPARVSFRSRRGSPALSKPQHLSQTVSDPGAARPFVGSAGMAEPRATLAPTGRATEEGIRCRDIAAGLSPAGGMHDYLKTAHTRSTSTGSHGGTTAPR